MKIITGTFLGYTEEERGYNDKQTQERKSFTSRKLHILDGVQSEQLELSQDFDRGSIPQDVHAPVQIEVFPKVSNGRLYWTALRVLVPAGK